MPSIYPMPQQDALVAMDEAHTLLLAGLVAAAKPRRILELGFGSGASFRRVLQAADAFRLDPEYTVVDNWFDHAGIRPAGTMEPPYLRATFITASEEAFVRGCTDTYDLIISDADHQRSQLWFAEVYERMLAPGGLLVSHDVCNPMFPGLAETVATCRARGWSHIVFNRNSLPGERCERGLLLVAKPA